MNLRVLVNQEYAERHPITSFKLKSYPQVHRMVHLSTSHQSTLRFFQEIHFEITSPFVSIVVVVDILLI